MRHFGLLRSAIWLGFGLTSAHDLQYVLSSDAEHHTSSSLRVAIIGAGAAGSSAAYHLAQYAEEVDLSLNLTIFERNTYIGGRSTTLNVYDDGATFAELGASIFVEVNHILVDAVKSFNLTTSAFGTQARTKLSAPSLGIYDGEHFVLTLSPSGATWWDTAKLLWKYGLAPVKTRNLMKATVGKFLTMYHAPHFPFSSMTGVVHDVDLFSTISSSGAQLLLDSGISAPFANDVVQASTRVNYAQNLPFIHGLETMVCMATDGAMAVENGNWRIFDHMVKYSGAQTLLASNVKTIKDNKQGSFSLKSVSHPTSKVVQPLESDFDAIIVAAPFHQTDIAFEITDLKTPENVPYVTLHVTLFTSPQLLSPTAFRLKNQPVPLTVLTTLAKDEAPQPGSDSAGEVGFFSISTLDIVENPKTGAEEYLYKVFSPKAMETPALLFLLGTLDEEDPGKHITWIERKKWLSYPYEMPRDTFDQVEIAKNLWYTGGMEAFISTMETNALMGKNVARLLVDRFAKKLDE